MLTINGASHGLVNFFLSLNDLWDSLLGVGYHYKFKYFLTIFFIVILKY